MSRVLKAAGCLALLAAGLLLALAVASGAPAADTTTETTLETTTETTTVTTAPTTTETLTTTVQQTTTRKVIVPPPTTETTTGGSNTSGTPTWVWIVLGALALALIVLAILFATRGRSGMSPQQRNSILISAVGGWSREGWGLESQTSDSAVLRRDDERMIVSVDQMGQVQARPLNPPPRGY